MVDDDVDVAVVVDVAERRARPTCFESKYGPALRVARRKRLPLQVAEEQGRLVVVDRSGPELRRLSSTWPLATKLSGQPSLSKSASAVPQPTHGMVSAARPKNGVASMNSPFAEIEVEGVVLVGEVGDEEVGTAVAVDVLGIDAHARLRLTFLVIGRCPRSRSRPQTCRRLG